jgi:hypothetical protein
MTKETPATDNCKKRNVNQHSSAGGVWFLGFIGTLAYYLHFHSGSFKLVVLAFIKAVFFG